MTGRRSDGSRGVSALELVGIGGFAFLFGWVFVACFWLFCEYPPDVPVAVRDLSQLAIFAGIPVGYVVLHLLGRSARFNLFSPLATGCAVVCSVSLSFAALLMFNGMHLPLWVVCAVNVLTGFAGAFFILAWLDVLSRLRCASYSRFVSLAFAGGVALFAISAVSPERYQPMFMLIYALCSLSLLVYLTNNADANDERAEVEAVAEPWRFTKEIEPSFFVFGIVFALSFVFLFNNGKEYVFWGVVATAVGALSIFVPSLLGLRLNITTVQRVLLVITVISCVILPFSEGTAQLLCACLTTAAWGAFKSINYAFIVKKSILVRDAPFFRKAPLRLSVSSFGFAVGWAIAAIITVVFGTHAEPFTTARLVMAVVLVIVVMVFFPQGEHHPADGTEAKEGTASKVVSVQMSESDLLNRKCDAVAKLFQLSPRETDILGYLARGRNAAWMQEELTVSPHTVKSHIYNIYRKLDIHSQQKLMSFVEDFPLDSDSLDG